MLGFVPTPFSGDGDIPRRLFDMTMLDYQGVFFLQDEGEVHAGGYDDYASAIGGRSGYKSSYTGRNSFMAQTLFAAFHALFSPLEQIPITRFWFGVLDSFSLGDEKSDTRLIRTLLSLHVLIPHEDEGLDYLGWA